MGERAIVRLDRRGQPDDIVIDGTMLHLERMDTGRWWLGMYRGDRRVAFSLRSKSRIVCEVVEDELGCRDDAEDPMDAAEVERTIAGLGMGADAAEAFRAYIRARFGIAEP